VYTEQRWSCCALISAINARTFLGGAPVDTASPLFEALASVVFCRNGAAIRPFRAWPVLGVVGRPIPVDLETIEANLPVALGYSDPKHGMHSALVVGVHDNGLDMVNAYQDFVPWETMNSLLDESRNILGAEIDRFGRESATHAIAYSLTDVTEGVYSFVCQDCGQPGANTYPLGSVVPVEHECIYCKTVKHRELLYDSQQENRL